MTITIIRRKHFLGTQFPRILWVLPLTGLLLLAADHAWKTKATSAWTAGDAQEVLTNSPWSVIVTAGITRKQTEDERRAGGEMGEAHGVGFDGVDNARRKAQLPKDVTDVFKPNPYTPPPAQFLKLRLRWESALPVRVAELKSGVIEPPTLEVDGYQIAVYGVPGEY